MEKIILMWHRLIKLFNSAKELLSNLGKEESDLTMKARDIGIINEEFENLYDRLTEAEEHLKRIATEYATGEHDVRMKDVDEAFSGVKKPLTDIRKLAIEAREAGKSNGE